MNTALRRSINLASIGSNFCEGGEEILKEETLEVPQLEGELESETGRKRKLQGKDIASKPGAEARASPFDPSHPGGSIPLGCAAQEERAADRWQAKREQRGRRRRGWGMSHKVWHKRRRKGYKEGKGSESLYLPGRGRSVVRMADGLGISAPLHYGAGDPSIFLRGACTS